MFINDEEIKSGSKAYLMSSLMQNSCLGMDFQLVALGTPISH